MHTLISGQYSVIVQYRFSNKEFKNAYNEVFDEFPLSEQVMETIYADTLVTKMRSLPPDSKIAFLVDDIVFIKKFDLECVTNFVNERDIFSLRLGLTLSKSNIVKSQQPLPSMKKTKNKIYTWSWHNSNLDWGYLFSLDGNVFTLNNIIKKIETIKFKGPNSLEAKLNKKFSSKGYVGGCFNVSVLVNLPLNRVQTEVSNWAGNYSTNELLEIFQSGKRLDLKQYINRLVTSVHEDWPLYVA